MIYRREGAWEAERVNEVQSCRGEVTQAEIRSGAGRGEIAHRDLGSWYPGRHSQSLRKGSGCGHSFFFHRGCSGGEQGRPRVSTLTFQGPGDQAAML